MLKYADLAKHSLVAANIAFVVGFILGFNVVLSMIAASLALLSGCFWVCQGKYKFGFYYGTILLAVGLLQHAFGLPVVFSIVSGAVGLVSIILQAIEYTFKDKSLIS